MCIYPAGTVRSSNVGTRWEHTHPCVSNKTQGTSYPHEEVKQGPPTPHTLLCGCSQMDRKLKLARKHASKKEEISEENVTMQGADLTTEQERSMLRDEVESGSEGEHAVTGTEPSTIVVDKSKKSGGVVSGVVWKNRSRVCIFSTRGITSRFRHLMEDFLNMLPQGKKESKMDAKDKLFVINEICEMRRCDYCVFFEMRKHTDCYMWLAKPGSNGPSAKFHLTNVHTMAEMKLMGNCLKYSRAGLVFDRNFDNPENPQWQVIKELLTQIFAVPRGHPNSKPFVDHIFSFFVQDNSVFFRHYQIVPAVDPENGKPKKGEFTLVEIGPRFTAELMRVFDGSFGGSTLYSSPSFVSPNVERRNERLRLREKYDHKQVKKQRRASKMVEESGSDSDDVFRS